MFSSSPPKIPEGTKQLILDAMSKVEHPLYKKDLRSLNMFNKLEIADTTQGMKYQLFLKSPDKDRRTQIQLESLLRSALSKLELPQKVVIHFQYDQDFKVSPPPKSLPGVKYLIAVGSGKGGVGKSTVSANLAVSLAKANYKVGLIDGDIYGPSLGKLFGVDGRLALGGDGRHSIMPYEAYGIKLISFSFLLNADQAVVWRGPMLGKAIEQFLFQVIWGNLDFLIFDLPPGTGDVQLSMAQYVDVNGALIVSTPQSLALQDARRAAYMFLGLKIPIIGIVENMSVYECPQCGHHAHIFSQKGADALATELQVPCLASLPLEQEMMEACEEGKPIALKAVAESSSAKSYHDLALNLANSFIKRPSK